MLNNVTFQDGGFASGQFTYNADSNTYSGINIRVTGPIYQAATPGTNFRDFTTPFFSTSNGLSFGGSNGDPQLVLIFASNLTNAVESINITQDASSYGFFGGTASLASSGNVQAVPLESDALPIVGAAAFMAGGFWFKRRRAQAKANLDFLGVASEK